MTTCTYTFENGDVVKGVPALKAYLVEHPELVEAKAARPQAGAFYVESNLNLVPASVRDEVRLEIERFAASVPIDNEQLYYSRHGTLQDIVMMLLRRTGMNDGEGRQLKDRLLAPGMQFENVVGDSAAAQPQQSPADANQNAADQGAVASANTAEKSAPGIIPNQIGERLAGGRKDRAALQAMTADLTDEQIASLPLSKIWPVEEIDKIEDTFTAAVSHAARAEIPAKPRTAYKVAGWVRKVKMYRGVVGDLLQRLGRDDLMTRLREQSDTLRGFATKITLLEAIDRKHWSRIGSVGEYPEATRYVDGKSVPSPFVQVEIDGKGQLYGGSTSIADVVERVTAKLEGEAGGKKMAFEVRGSGNKYFINKKGDKEYRQLKTFDNAKDAIAFRNNNYDDLVAAWEAVKERDNVRKTDVRRDENRDRTGKDWRKGKDATDDDFMSAFGFKGAEFGDWVNQGKGERERQGLLNQAYDALMDLADVLGIPPKAISLNGSLGIAFGSRGSGNAAAHFEPSNLVINLTKTRGAGSLAHEWFHALDNYFARQRGGEVPFTGDNAAYRRNNYVTYKPEPMYVHKKASTTALTKAQLQRYHQQDPRSSFYNPENWMLDPKHPEGIRPAVEARFAELVEALDASPMAQRSARNDKSPTDGYWSRIIERGARAFENYVITKMRQQGYQNDYLANVRSPEEFFRSPDRYPYLLESEVGPVKDAFDSLFSTIETKETPQGVAMLSRASRSAPQSLAEVESSWDSQGIENALSEKDGIITLHKIIVPKGEREAGIGTKAMQELLAYADATGQQVALTPSGDFGGNKRRLESFYRGLGFRTYKGFAVREKLIRDPANPDIRYSFAGQSAQTADTHALATAQARLAAGEDAETVRQETGWFRGADGRFRYEIDDSQASIKGSGTVAEVFAQANAQSDRAADRLRARIGDSGRRLDAKHVYLSQILDHPALFAAYPELGSIRVTVGEDMGQTQASIRETGDGFEVLLSPTLKDEKLLSALLHEVQHGIQTIEGFATGASGYSLTSEERRIVGFKKALDQMPDIQSSLGPDFVQQTRSAANAALEAAFDRYTRSAGEVEARNTQARANLTPEQRRATPPSQTADVADADVIVVFNGKEAAFAPPPANAKARGTPLRAVRALANKIQRSYANLPKVHVFASPADLPAEAAGLRAEIARQGAENDAEGAMFDGAIYLFADNLSSLERAEFVLAEHEVAHLGLRGVFGDNLEPVLRQIAVRNPKVREAAREAQKRGKLSLTAAVEEVLADMPTAELAQLKGWRKLVEMARDWFAGKGFERIAAKLDSLLQGAISEQEAADLYVAEVVRAARDWVKGGKGEAGKGAALSRGLPATVTVDGVERPTMNSEGRPIHPAEAGIRNFWRWFGDSKVVDAQGRPRVVYHGTDKDFSTFSKDGVETLGFPDKQGFYFTADAEYAEAYGLTLMPAYLSLQNPYRAPLDGYEHTYISPARRVELEAQGFDSVIFDGNADRPSEIVAFRPEQIKSATGNNGDFNPANPDIRLSRAPAALKSQFQPGTGTRIIDDSGRPYTKEQREMYRATGREVEVKTVRDKVDELRADFGKKLAQGIFDQFAPVKDLSKHAYGLLRLAKGASGAFEVLMKGGKLKLEDGAYAFDKDQKGGVIDRLLVPLQGEGGDFLWWVAANRAGQLKAETAKAHAEGEQFRADAKDKEAQAQRLEAEAKQVLQQAGNFPKSALGSIRMQQQNARTAESLLREAKALRAEAAEDRKEATRLLSISRENLFTDEHIAAGKTLSDGETPFDYTLRYDHAGHKAGTVTRNRSLIYRDSLRIFNEFNKNTLDMAEQSGLIDPESRKVWEREFYVPFYRVSEDEGGIKGVNVKNGYVRQEAFKHLKGGKDKLNSDLLENTLMNWAHLIDAAAKNRGAVATLAAGEKVGASAPNLKAGFSWGDGKVIDDETGLPAGGTGEVKPEYTTAGKGTVWAMIGGKQAHYTVSDPYVLTAITALEYAGLRGPVMDVMSKFKNVLTIGVTASPFFKIRNLIRDSLQAIATTDLDYNPAKNVKSGLDAVNAGEAGKNFLKAAANAATMGKAGFKLNETHTDEYFDMLAGGGLIRFGTMLEGSEAKRTRALVEKGVDPDTILDNESKVTAFYKRVVEPLIESYNELGNKSEEITRAALYRKLRKEGRSHLEASLEARDTMDFSMQGSFASVRFLTQVVPFMNARLQGLYKLGRAHNQDKRRFYAVVGATTLVSLALLAAYGDDDDWKRREEWDRDNYWWLKIGGEAIRIPKPFEVGALATLAERSAEYLFDDEMNGSRFRDRVLSLASSQLAMNPVPQAFKPLIDLYANQDSFTGRPIETMGMERLDPSYRFTMNTSAAARAISSAGNAATSAVVGEEKFLSPVQVDHILRAYFGWLGSFVTGGVDMMVDAASDGPAKPARDVAKFFTGGMLAELDGAPSRYVSQMYEQAKELEQAYATWNHLKKEGKTEEAAEYLEANQEDIARYRSVERVKKDISGLTKEIRTIERSDLDPTEKRERINALRNQQNEIAKTL